MTQFAINYWKEIIANFDRSFFKIEQCAAVYGWVGGGECKGGALAEGVRRDAMSKLGQNIGNLF